MIDFVRNGQSTPSHRHKKIPAKGMYQSHAAPTIRWVPISIVAALGIMSLDTRVSSAEKADRDAGLIGHWAFQERAGHTIADLSGNGNDAKIIRKNVSDLERKPSWGEGKFANSICFEGGTFARVSPSTSLNKLNRQITVAAHVYPSTLWSPPTLSQRFSRKLVRLAGKIIGTELSPDISLGSGYLAVVQRQWREAAHPDLFYLGYGQENNTLHYKWHLGLVGAEVSLYRLPEGENKPVVGQWVHLAGTYNGASGQMSLYVNGKSIGTETHVGEISARP